MAGFTSVRLRDITQEKMLKKQLLHEKLSSLALVAGIAHELNNPLMGIMGFKMLRTPGEKTNDIKDKLRKIYESLRTAKRAEPPDLREGEEDGEGVPLHKRHHKAHHRAARVLAQGEQHKSNP
jgi:signal transduction histidine kinase